MGNGINSALVSANHYNPAILYNRMGQFFYRTGDIAKAKVLFVFSALCDENFRIKNKG